MRQFDRDAHKPKPKKGSDFEVEVAIPLIKIICSGLAVSGIAFAILFSFTMYAQGISIFLGFVTGCIFLISKFADETIHPIIQSMSVKADAQPYLDKIDHLEKLVIHYLDENEILIANHAQTDRTKDDQINTLRLYVRKLENKSSQETAIVQNTPEHNELMQLCEKMIQRAARAQRVDSVSISRAQCVNVLECTHGQWKKARTILLESGCINGDSDNGYNAVGSYDVMMSRFNMYKQVNAL